MNKLSFIFDLDGVVVDTADFHFNAWKKTASSLDFELTKQLNESLKGVSRKRSLERILIWAGKRIPKQEFEKIMHAKNEDYLRQVSGMTKADILPGVIPFIKAAKKNGHKVALGSASKNAQTILEKVGLLEHFDAIVDGTKVTKAKPNPEVFIIAATLLDVHPEHCIVFEDSVAGIKAANNADMYSIGIGDKNILTHASEVYKDFTKIKFSAIVNHKRFSSI